MIRICKLKNMLDVANSLELNEAKDVLFRNVIGDMERIEDVLSNATSKLRNRLSKEFYYSLLDQGRFKECYDGLYTILDAFKGEDIRKDLFYFYKKNWKIVDYFGYYIQDTTIVLVNLSTSFTTKFIKEYAIIEYSHKDSKALYDDINQFVKDNSGNENTLKYFVSNIISDLLELLTKLKAGEM